MTERNPHLWLGRLTAVMIRGRTELRVRVDEEMPCVLVEMDGTPCPVLLGVTKAGTENATPVLQGWRVEQVQAATGFGALTSRLARGTGRAS